MLDSLIFQKLCNIHWTAALWTKMRCCCQRSGEMASLLQANRKTTIAPLITIKVCRRVSEHPIWRWHTCQLRIGTYSSHDITKIDNKRLPHTLGPLVPIEHCLNTRAYLSNVVAHLHLFLTTLFCVKAVFVLIFWLLLPVGVMHSNSQRSKDFFWYSTVLQRPSKSWDRNPT